METCVLCKGSCLLSCLMSTLSVVLVLSTKRVYLYCFEGGLVFFLDAEDCVSAVQSPCVKLSSLCVSGRSRWGPWVWPGRCCPASGLRF